VPERVGCLVDTSESHEGECWVLVCNSSDKMFADPGIDVEPSAYSTAEMCNRGSGDKCSAASDLPLRRQAAADNTERSDTRRLQFKNSFGAGGKIAVEAQALVTDVAARVAWPATRDVRAIVPA